MTEAERVATRAQWGRSLFVLVFFALVGTVGWLVYDERKQGEKLEGVNRVGPCRAVGITDPECQKQARRIFAACYIQRRECREKYGLVLVRIRPDRSDRGEVVHLNPSRAGQQPAPGGRPGDRERSERPDRRPDDDAPAGDEVEVPPQAGGASAERPPVATPPADPAKKGPVGSAADDAGSAVGEAGDRVDDTTCSLAPQSPFCTGRAAGQSGR